MASDKEKLLKTAKKNLDAIGDALGKKLGAAIEKQDTSAESSGLEQVKNSFTKPVGALTKIPDEVYKKIAETLNDNAKISSIFIEYSTNEGKCIKQVATQIGKLLKKLDDIKVPVEENGKTVTYKVEFSGTRLGVSGNFIKISRGNKNSWINWKDEAAGKNAMAQYCASLYNLGKKVTSARKIIIKSLVEEGSKLLSAVFNDGTESVYKKVFGNSDFKKITKAYGKSEIGKVVKSVKGKKISEALTQYEGLNNLYNNLAFEVNSASGDGNDVIADFTKNDKINLTSGSIKKVTKSGNDVTFKIGSGSIKVQNGKDKEITIVDADNFEKKYLNGKLISSVPADALKYNGHSYKIYSDVADTWEEEKVYCESLGGHLAVINDDAENTALFNYMNSKGYMEAYFGLSDATNEGTWTWVNDEPLSYINWGGSEPNGYTYENYGMFIDWVFSDGKWIDGDFKGTKNFICEWDNGGSLDEIVGFTAKSSNALLTADFDEPNNLLDKVTFAKSDNKK